mgnify:CR=1 FL=1
MTATSPLVLGPLLRFVGEHHASIWVQTSGPARVSVVVDGHTHDAATFVVEGHHYALVVVGGLAPGRTYAYSVHVDDAQVWPLADGTFPEPTIATLDRLVVLDRGRIVEEGRHAELVERGGLYARLWSRQSGGFLSDGRMAEAAE